MMKLCWIMMAVLAGGYASAQPVASLTAQLGNVRLLTVRLVPDAVGAKAYLHAPSHTLWRTIVVSNKAADTLASKLILNLNEPSKIADTSWIK